MNDLRFEQRTYRADPVKVQQNKRMFNTQILFIIVGILLIIFSFYFGNGADNYLSSKSDRDFYSLMETLSIIVGIICLVSSPIEMVIYYNAGRKLSDSYLSIYPDCIHGTSFPTSSTSQVFNVPYDELIEVYTVNERNGNNICIRSTRGTYYCYCIENHCEAVDLIDELKALYDAVAYVPQSAAAPVYTPNPVSQPVYQPNPNSMKYCMTCGTPLPIDASFCCNCGSAQQYQQQQPQQ